MGPELPATVDGTTTEWVDVRCQSHAIQSFNCADKGRGRGRLLFRYTTDCLSAGGVIETKCYACNTIIRVSE